MVRGMKKTLVYGVWLAAFMTEPGHVRAEKELKLGPRHTAVRRVSTSVGCVQPPAFTSASNQSHGLFTR
jgi:hypothetical protein